MFTIGDFARHGRVSVRMLRHYDQTGLLPPAHVDPATGYRYYHAAQLAVLNRIVALKDLGFTLRQVADILHESVSVPELRGMLKLRQAELHERIAADTARLTQVEGRLHTLETEGQMSANDVHIKHIPAVRAAELTDIAEGFEPSSIGPVVGPLFTELCTALNQAGVAPTGPGIAYYEDAEDGSVLVHAAVPVDDEVTGHGVDIVELPEIERAATIVHHGPMDNVLTTMQDLARWVDDNGYHPAGYPREVTLECTSDGTPTVTELQEPIAP